MKLFLYFFVKSIFAFILTFSIFAIARREYVSRNKVKTNLRREFLIRVFVGYLAILAVLLFTPNAQISAKGINLSSANFDFVGNFKDRIYDGSWGMNFVPFRTIKSYLKYSGFKHAMINIVGNIIIFIPFGRILPEIYRRSQNLLNIFFILLFTSCVIEFIQFFIGRSVDIDDIMLNVIGGIIGFVLWQKFAPKRKRRGKFNRSLNK